MSAAQVHDFSRDGFVRLDDAVPLELVDQCQTSLWRDAGCDASNPATWTNPVIRLGDYSQEPFALAANTPRLHAAFDQLVGTGRWLKRGSLGTFPIRSPSSEDPGDTGWHIDVSFGEDMTDFMSWRADVTSRGRALLMLFLFSDVGEHDAPTRIRVGSHLAMARALAPAGEAGRSLRGMDFDLTNDHSVALATGKAGTVYLCHPFLVHAAQPHRGTTPRIIAQPPFLYKRRVILQDMLDELAKSAQTTGSTGLREQGYPPHGLD